MLFQEFAAAPLSAQEATPTAAEEAAALVEERDPDPWPRVIEAPEVLVKIHPPQVDKWDGRTLEAHSAVELQEQGEERSIYGIVDFIVRTRVDKDARLVVYDEYLGIRATLPSQPDKEAWLLGFLQKERNDAMRVTSVGASGAVSSRMRSSELPLTYSSATARRSCQSNR